MNQTEPNLFYFAPKELSQDAVLCWLLSWADSKFRLQNPELNEAGCRLLELLFQKHEMTFPREVGIQVARQVDHVDIVVEVGHQYLVLIEDKTKTNHHSDQLNRYLNTVRKKHPGRQILPIFLKTEDQCDYSDINACGYFVCDRSDILSCIWPQKQDRISSDLLRNFAEYLNQKEESVQSFEYKPVCDWDHGQWVGFYKNLKSHIPDLKWHWVNNKGGGFMAAYWGIQRSRARIYLQIEQELLCFKISASGAANPSSLRKLWHERVMKSGSRARDCSPERPARFGVGKHMTVAVVPQEKWLAVSEGGSLDMQQTLCRLNAATRLLKRVTRLT